MKKRLVFISGAMGAGKTAVTRALQNILRPAAMLDGDWCWDIKPFTVNDETKEMVLGNIAFLLRQFLASPACENILFCWVMDHKEIADELFRRIGPEALQGAETWQFTVACTPETLEAHIRGDIRKGLRAESDIPRSLARLPLYAALPTIKVPADGRTAEEVAAAIARAILQK